MSRNYRMDNMKCLLIALVIFGHYLELTGNGLSVTLYRIIYSFHMPAFLFITGYFARYNPKKILLSFVYPYFIFQILYLLFDAYILQEVQHFTLQFTTPYWILWYLLVVIFYYLLLPLFQTKKHRSQLLILLASVILSLLSGFGKTIGYFLSLSRFFTFLPYFLAGYFTSGYLEKWLSKLTKKHFSISRILLSSGVFLSILYIVNADFPKTALYGSCSYSLAKYTPFIKVLLMLAALCWIAFLLLLIPNKKWKLLSIIGENTFSIFLLHGFLLRLAKKYRIFQGTEPENICLAFALTIVLLLILGNPPISRLFHFLFTGGWIKKSVKAWKNRHTKE